MTRTDPEDVMKRMLEMMNPGTKIADPASKAQRQKKIGRPVTSRNENSTEGPPQAEPLSKALEVAEIRDEISDFTLEFDRESILQGIVFATIFSSPPGNRRFRGRFNNRTGI